MVTKQRGTHIYCVEGWTPNNRLVLRWCATQDDVYNATLQAEQEGLTHIRETVAYAAADNPTIAIVRERGVYRVVQR